MKPYMIEVTTHAVVMANCEEHARLVAEIYRGEIIKDDWSPQIEVWGTVEQEQDFDHGWDGECIPYGGDGTTTLKHLLAASGKEEQQ